MKSDGLLPPVLGTIWFGTSAAARDTRPSKRRADVDTR
jgi:hypothetical protein